MTGTEAMCFTGKTQLGWLGQLVAAPVRHVLHIDGKYKLHHGKWMLITIGTHSLEKPKGGAEVRTSTCIHVYPSVSTCISVYQRVSSRYILIHYKMD